MIEANKLRIPPEELRLECDPASFEFECTEELTPLTEFVGQERGLRALQFGLGLEKPGYNIFVTGLTGTGKATAIMEHIQRTIEERRQAGDLTLPDDSCYVYNFGDPDRPNALRLPTGMGRKLRDQLEELLAAARASVGRAFASEEYEHRRREIVEHGQQEAQHLMEEAQRDAERQGFLLQFSPVGVGLVPLAEGKPMSAEEFAALNPARRSEIEATQQRVMEGVAEAGERLRAIEREVTQRLRHLDRQVGETALAGLFDSVISQNQPYPEVVRFLQKLHDFTLSNVELLRDRNDQPGPAPVRAVQPDPFLAFRCNVFVDNSQATGPPIIVENNPTWANLFGRIERRALMGTYFSDHTMLRPGSVHRADGGYIILNLIDILTKPGSWDGLKRLIRTKQVRLEDPLEQYGLLTPQALQPEPFPVDLKIVVTGDPLAYFLLSAYDEEFWEMFKVKADFDVQIARTRENALAYAGFICACCQRDGLRHFDRTAVARVVEQGSRMVDDQEKLSARFGRLCDLIVEADYWAGQAASSIVSAQHVERAIGEKIYRLNLIEERIRELITRGVIMVDVTGSVVGQVNGLSVLDFGEFSFGRPSRITARTFMGQKGVTSIDRESQLSGHIHNKGVLILSGYLRGKYATKRPMSLTASLAFEQSYGGVDGDSASSTEVYAILSSLSGLPLRQDLAVTGSLNQKGEIQPIGGVNEKIEGFFDVCRAKGLTGTQGVLIPHQNVQNLMLRAEVVDAVKAGKFHVYTVRGIDEGIEILTGVEAGTADANAEYPDGTVHGLVDRELQRLAKGLKAFAGPADRGEGPDGSK